MASAGRQRGTDGRGKKTSGILVPEVCPGHTTTLATRSVSTTTYAKELGDWLDSQGDWTYWSTITQRPRHKWDGVRSMTSWRRAMDQWCETTGADRIFWATEEGRLYGRSHVHALIYYDPHRTDPEQWGFSMSIPSAQALWDLTYRAYGRAHIDKYDPKLGAAHYCGKYVTKKIADYDIFTRQHLGRTPHLVHGHRQGA